MLIGTHDIHALILGRAITGLQAFTADTWQYCQSSTTDISLWFTNCVTATLIAMWLESTQNWLHCYHCMQYIILLQYYRLYHMIWMIILCRIWYEIIICTTCRT